jgi:hypothetical protein
MIDRRSSEYTFWVSDLKSNYHPDHVLLFAACLTYQFISSAICDVITTVECHPDHVSNSRPGNYGSDYHRPHQQPTSWQVHSTSPMPQDAARSSPWQSPMQFQDPMSGYQGGPPSAPRPWGSHSGPGGRGSYSNPPNFGFRHPNPSRGGSPMNYGPRGGPYSSYGRGRGPNYFGSPGSRGRGGRVGCHGRSYFNKSMLDDPWLDLQPGVGNILIPRGEYDSNKSWLPESLRKKKETPPAQGQIKPTPGLSLAEYLDMSFNEVSDKEK